MPLLPCRICTEPTSGGDFDDHESICPTCLDEAVLDAYLADIPDEPIVREQVTRAFFTSRDRRRHSPDPEARIEAIEIGGERLPLPDDLRISELIELLGPDVEIERIDDDRSVGSDFPIDRWKTEISSPAPHFPALAGELHRFSSFVEEESGDDVAEYPGFRLFRVLERDGENEDGSPRYAIRRIYRRD